MQYLEDLMEYLEDLIDSPPLRVRRLQNRGLVAGASALDERGL
jgi:hypothetical protein